MAWGMKNRTLCLFGSSIMEGRIGVEKAADRWYRILEDRLSERFPDHCFAIVNAAVGGESTRECMARFDRDVLACRPDYCLFMIGANNHDCSRPERMLADGELDRHMADFAARLPAATTPVGVILNPCVDAWHATTRHPAFRELYRLSGGLNALLEEERERFRAFLRARGWPFLDLNALFKEAPERYILRTDGIHLTPAAHRLFGEAMADLLAPMVAAASGSDVG